MSPPIAPRFEITVLKDKSGTDKSQVIASGASIQFYRQGATVKSSVTLASHATVIVEVFDVGQIAFADTVRVASTAYELSVMDVPSQTQVELYNGNLVSVGLIAGTRLMPVNDPAPVYADPLATVSLGSTVSVDSATGRASAYLANDRVDYEVSIPGQASRLYVDGAGVLGRSDRRWSDLRDYGGDLQAAVDGLPPDGGIVFVPRGEWSVASGVTIDKPNVTILGETAGSRLKVPGSQIDQFDLLTVRAERFQLRDIVLDAAATAYNSTGHSCLVLAGSRAAGISVRGASLWNVSILGGARYGIWLKDCEDFHASQCFVVFNRGAGVRIESVSGVSRNICFVGGEMGQNSRQGVEATDLDGLLLLGTGVEGNRLAAGESEGAGVDVRNSTRVALRSCYFEDAYNGTTIHTSQFVYVQSCPSAVVDTCWFQGGDEVARQPLLAIKFANSVRPVVANSTSNGIKDFVLLCDQDSNNGMDTGVLDFDSPYARLSIAAERHVSMSNSAINAIRCIDSNSRPLGPLPPGSMIWVDSPSTGQSKLQVWNGSVWKNATLT